MCPKCVVLICRKTSLQGKKNIRSRSRSIDGLLSCHQDDLCLSSQLNWSTRWYLPGAGFVQHPGNHRVETLGAQWKVKGREDMKEQAIECKGHSSLSSFLHFFLPLCLNRSPSDHLEPTQWFLLKKSSQEATKLVSSRAPKSVTAYDPIRKSHPQFSHIHTYIIWKVHSKGLPGIKQTGVAFSLLSKVHLDHFLARGR